MLREKRRKLHETWNRVMGMYEKEDVEQYSQLRSLWSSYLQRKHEMTTHFEAVKNAQNVRVDDIPLPSAEAESGEGGMDAIPLPPQQSATKLGIQALFASSAGAGILKKPSVL